MGIIVGFGNLPTKGEFMAKILSIDPSGTGKTGTCLIEGKKITFQEFKSKVWPDHLNFINLLIAKQEPELLLYETTNYINSRGKDMTSLFRLMGAIESLLLKKASVLVNQVKDLKAKLLAGTKQIPELTFAKGRGKGWMFKGQRISLHELEAFLVYWIWKERRKTCFESSEKGGRHG